MERPRRGMVVVALGMVAVGLVWIGQGLGILRGSGFMVDDVRWAIIGLALIAVGVVIGTIAVRGSRASR